MKSIRFPSQFTGIYQEIGLLPVLLISLLIALFTFPPLNPVFANGIDPPLSWVFNYLVQGHLQAGKEIIFPHGPLAFFMYPLPMGFNLILVMILHLILRTAFAFALIRLPEFKNPLWLMLAVAISFVLLALLDILLVMTGLVALGSLQYLRSRKMPWIILAISVTVAALYVKAFVGIICGLLTTTFFLLLCYQVYKKKENRQRLLPFLLLPALLVMVWIILYGSFTGLPRYFYGMFQLAGDNSSAVAYYPDNNWWYLSAAFLSIVILIFLLRKQSASWQFFFLMAPALFAVWKYGMAREDYLHAGMMFLFILMTAFLLVLLVSGRRIHSAVAGFIVVALFFLNLQNVFYYETPKFSVSGLRNFAGVLINYEEVADTSNQASYRNIRRNILDRRIRSRIGNSTTDIYPWDYSFIPANNLNWQPRPVLQSYACYTPWLDHENAIHFESGKSPEFVIWELRKITHDIHNGTLESIDGRYLLNDQPETVLSILANYELVDKQGGTFPVLVYKKRTKPIVLERKFTIPTQVNWDQWIDVNQSPTDILRAKVDMSRNFSGRLSGFFYKDEACFVYYLLENGEIRMFRIVPKNASQGLWINPLIMNPENGRPEPRVIKIMFRCTNPARMQTRISLQWELIKTDGINIDLYPSEIHYQTVSLMFGITRVKGNVNLLRSLNTLEKPEKGWSDNPNPEMTKEAHSGKTSCLVPPDGFSMSYECSLDSVLASSSDTAFIVRAMTWIYATDKVEANYVISIEQEGKSLEWKAVKINDFVLEKKKWNYVINFLVLKPEVYSRKGLRLKIYAWNLGKTPFLLDDPEVRIDGWAGN